MTSASKYFNPGCLGIFQKSLRALFHSPLQIMILYLCVQYTAHVDPSYVWSWSTLLGCILRADEYWFKLLFIRFIAILSSRWFLFMLSRTSMNFRISSLNLSNYAWMQIHLVLGLTSLLVLLFKAVMYWKLWRSWKA